MAHWFELSNMALGAVGVGGIGAAASAVRSRVKTVKALSVMQKAIKEQEAFEKSHPVRYDQDQRAIAIAQRCSRLLGKVAKAEAKIPAHWKERADFDGINYQSLLKASQGGG